jgi:2-hydroxychromene-2-carboxylate isomerase
MHELLFAHQTHLDLRRLQGYAEQLGLDMARYTAEMDDHVYLQRVREHIDSAKRSGVRGTPGFFVDGMILDVSFGFGSLIEATEAAFKGALNDPKRGHT